MKDDTRSPEHQHPWRRRMFPVTPLREKRLRAVRTLAEVATEAGMSLARASIIERDATKAKGDELDRLSAAIDRLQERE